MTLWCYTLQLYFKIYLYKIGVRFLKILYFLFAFYDYMLKILYRGKHFRTKMLELITSSIYNSPSVIQLSYCFSYYCHKIVTIKIFPLNMFFSLNYQKTSAQSVFLVDCLIWNYNLRLSWRMYLLNTYYTQQYYFRSYEEFRNKLEEVYYLVRETYISIIKTPSRML